MLGTGILATGIGLHAVAVDGTAVCALAAPGPLATGAVLGAAEATVLMTRVVTTGSFVRVVVVVTCTGVLDGAGCCGTAATGTLWGGCPAGMGGARAIAGFPGAMRAMGGP